MPEATAEHPEIIIGQPFRDMPILDPSATLKEYEGVLMGEAVYAMKRRWTGIMMGP
jgi:hypothetical protein